MSTTTAMFTKEVRLNFVEGSKNRFKCRFIEPGLVSYAEQKDGGIELLRKPTIDKALNTFVGKNLQLGHFNSAKHGVIDKVYFNSEDGWYYAEGSVDTDEARQAIEKGLTVSCGYAVHELGEGGKHHGCAYKQEILDITFDHMAIVRKPRYEDAELRFNSMNKVFKWIKQLVVRENAATPTETVDLHGDSEVEINGKTVKLNELIESYAKLNTAEELSTPTGLTPEAPKVNEAEKPKEGTKLSEEPKATESEGKGVVTDAALAPLIQTENQLQGSSNDVLGMPVNTDALAPKSLKGFESLKINDVVIDKEAATIELPPMDRTLDPKAQGLKHFNDLHTAKERFKHFTNVETSNENPKSREACLARGKKLF